MKIIIQCSVCGNKVEIDKKPNSVVDLKKFLMNTNFPLTRQPSKIMHSSL